MDLNPAYSFDVASSWTGDIDLACFRTGSNIICLSFTFGGTTSFSDDYVGLLVNIDYGGGFPYHLDCQVTKDLTRNVWSTVTLSGSTSDGTIAVTVNGANALSGCTASFDPDTKSYSWYGMNTSGNTSFPFFMNYDDVQVTVRR
jgi:hypothetical protein